ncbi:MAG: hypothetical protein ACHQRJ_19255 [Alphaproteobacteria bacterium]
MAGESDDAQTIVSKPVDPLSPSTRATKRNLLLVATAAIVVKTFQLGSSPITYSGVIINAPMLVFVLALALLYLGVTFALYYVIDICNVSATQHQQIKRHISRQRREAFRLAQIERMLKEMAKLVPEFFVYNDSPNYYESMFATKESLRSRVTGEEMSQHANTLSVIYPSGRPPPDLGKLNSPETVQSLEAKIKLIGLAHLRRYRWASFRYRAYVRLRLELVEMLYRIRNYGTDGILPIVWLLVAFGDLYGFIDLAWVLRAMPAIQPNVGAPATELYAG